MGYDEAAGAIATTPMPAAPRQINPGAYNPAVFKAKADKDAYAASVARSLGGAGGAGGLSDALARDPTYQKLSQIHADAQQAHVLGVATPEYGRMQAATNYLANAAGAVSTDAGSRQTQAAGGYARDVGQGKAFEGQGNLSNAQANETAALVPSKVAASAAETNRVRELTPVEKAAGYAQANQGNALADRTKTVAPAEAAQGFAQANLTNAGASNVNALTPPQIAQGNAQAAKTAAETADVQQTTKLRPQVLLATQAIAGQERDLEHRKAESEINKNNRNPITGKLDAPGGSPTGSPVAGAAPGPAAGVGSSPAGTSPAPGAASRVGSFLAAHPLMAGVVGGPIPGAGMAAGLGARAMQAQAAGPSAPAAGVGSSPAGTSPAPGAASRVASFLAHPLMAGVVPGAGMAADLGARAMQAAGPSAPAGPVAPASVAPQRKQLPDGRIVEVDGNNVFQILPDGSRRPLKVTP
jgi:hypothetical protein